jgi:hypothetical protein
VEWDVAFIIDAAIVSASLAKFPLAFARHHTQPWKIPDVIYVSLSPARRLEHSRLSRRRLRHVALLAVSSRSARWVFKLPPAARAVVSRGSLAGRQSPSEPLSLRFICQRGHNVRVLCKYR